MFELGATPVFWCQFKVSQKRDVIGIFRVNALRFSMCFMLFSGKKSNGTTESQIICDQCEFVAFRIRLVRQSSVGYDSHSSNEWVPNWDETFKSSVEAAS